MTKRITNTVLALAMFLALYYLLEIEFVEALALSELTYIGNMLYDIHGYLEKINKSLGR